MSAACRFEGRMCAVLHRRWKLAASRTKQPSTPSWRHKADFRSALPVSCWDLGSVLLATYAAPLPFSASIIVERKPKVVRTRPGWMGEW